MYTRSERLILFDADGTTVDAFSAIDTTFARHGMEIGDLERFQKRRKLFKYLGGIREFPVNLKKQFGKRSRKELIATLTEVYREEATLYPGVAALLRELVNTPNLRIGLVTRNVTHEPALTLRRLFARHDVDLTAFDFMACLSLSDDKKHAFKMARERFAINPARSHACGDEFSDFSAALASGMHPFVVSYGFEDHKRLTRKFEVPDEVISRTPEEFCARVRNALDLEG
ncbi:HAD hydrolase-like protein [Niveibacterium sp. 24ML]|uniref:HAD family hydrolase n=1 Tax=Niveibacterium sp. 24ML TaxID=2985512 RepID=UPI00226FEB8F|nr:HAD hydrolase-like protein [Niveibacterium sp. 24ML]MCX9157227.1 HAD hydrolase-like protein [Niveibacterium sp. 24ML]